MPGPPPLDPSSKTNSSLPPKPPKLPSPKSPSPKSPKSKQTAGAGPPKLPPPLNKFASESKPKSPKSPKLTKPKSPHSPKSPKAKATKPKPKKVKKVKKAEKNGKKDDKKNEEAVIAPPELAPLSSPSPSPDKDKDKDKERFRGLSLPNGWLDCPLEFIQPMRDHRILVCKTPIDKEIAKYFKIPKDKLFLPHTIYTLPTKHYQVKQQSMGTDKKRKIGLVIDLTNQMFYDEISFNNGKKIK